MRPLEALPTPELDTPTTGEFKDFSLDLNETVMRSGGNHVVSPFQDEYGIGNGMGRGGAGVVAGGVKSQAPTMLERATTLNGMKDLCASFASKTTLPSSSPFSMPPFPVPSQPQQQKPTFLRAFSTPTLPSTTQLPSLGDNLTLRPVPRHYEPFSSFSTSSPAPVILHTLVKALEAIDRCYYTYCPSRHTIRGIVYLQHTSSTFVFHLYEHTHKTVSTERFLGELKRCSGCSISFRQFYQTVMEACSSLFQQEGIQKQQQQQQQPFHSSLSQCLLL